MYCWSCAGAPRESGSVAVERGALQRAETRNTAMNTRRQACIHVRSKQRCAQWNGLPHAHRMHGCPAAVSTTAAYPRSTLHWKAGLQEAPHALIIMTPATRTCLSIHRVGHKQNPRADQPKPLSRTHTSSHHTASSYLHHIITQIRPRHQSSRYVVAAAGDPGRRPPRRALKALHGALCSGSLSLRQGRIVDQQPSCVHHGAPCTALQGQAQHEDEAERLGRRRVGGGAWVSVKAVAQRCDPHTPNASKMSHAAGKAAAAHGRQALSLAPRARKSQAICRHCNADALFSFLAPRARPCMHLLLLVQQGRVVARILQATPNLRYVHCTYRREHGGGPAPTIQHPGLLQLLDVLLQPPI